MKQFIPAIGLVLTITSTGVAQIEHVIQISIDGLRSDRVQELSEASPESMVNFLRLQYEGASTFNARSDFTHTFTIPNHASMLTGRPVSQPAGQLEKTHHGYVRNVPPPDETLHSGGNPEVVYFHSTFDVVHDHGMSTAFFATKDRLAIYERSWNEENGAPDIIGADNGNGKIDNSLILNRDTSGILDALESAMANDAFNYTFLHLTDPDSAGHGSGFLSAEYDAAVLATNDQLGRILEMIVSNPGLAGTTAIVMTADHGGGDPSNNHSVAASIENYQIPFYVWGAGIEGGTDAYGSFANRYDPGDGRPDYDAALQPLWTGDAGNIALDLLGLPPIPGSTLIPVPEPSALLLVLFGIAMLCVHCRRC